MQNVYARGKPVTARFAGPHVAHVLLADMFRRFGCQHRVTASRAARHREKPRSDRHGWRRGVERHSCALAGDADRDVPASAGAAAAPDLEEQLALNAPLHVPQQSEIAVVDGHRRDLPETAIDPQHRAGLQICPDGDDFARALSVSGRPKQALGPREHLHGLSRRSAARELADDAQWDHRRRSSRA